MTTWEEYYETHMSPLIEKGEIVPICEKDRLFLRTRNPGEIAEWFANLFADVWQQIPVGRREAIAAYWRQGSFCEPSVELSDMWCNNGRVGQTESMGRALLFEYSWLCHEPPAEVVQWVIAHELGHVWQWAEGDERMVQGYNEDVENDASQFARELGFWSQSDRYMGWRVWLRMRRREPDVDFPPPKARHKRGAEGGSG